MARRALLEFEKPLVELEEQIEQIRQLARDSEVDVSQQLLQLETLATRRRKDIFEEELLAAGLSPRDNLAFVGLGDQEARAKKCATAEAAILVHFPHLILVAQTGSLPAALEWALTLAGPLETGKYPRSLTPF